MSLGLLISENANHWLFMSFLVQSDLTQQVIWFLKYIKDMLHLASIGTVMLEHKRVNTYHSVPLDKKMIS